MLLRSLVRRFYGMAALPTPNPDCRQYRATIDSFLPPAITLPTTTPTVAAPSSSSSSTTEEPTVITSIDVPYRSLADIHPLSSILFDQYEREVRAVFIAERYVTITKWSDIEWDSILERSIGGLLSNFLHVHGAVAPNPKYLARMALMDADLKPQPGDTEVVLCIKELLRTELRPMVQRDGGDLRFLRFEESSGVVELRLLGACRTCPSSQNTLKDGILRMLQHFVPEVKSVLEIKEMEGGEEEVEGGDSDTLTTSSTGNGPREIGRRGRAKAAIAERERQRELAASTSGIAADTDDGELLTPARMRRLLDLGKDQAEVPTGVAPLRPRDKDDMKRQMDSHLAGRREREEARQRALLASLKKQQPATGTGGGRVISSRGALNFDALMEPEG